MSTKWDLHLNVYLWMYPTMYGGRRSEKELQLNWTRRWNTFV